MPNRRHFLGTALASLGALVVGTKIAAASVQTQEVNEPSVTDGDGSYGPVEWDDIDWLAPDDSGIPTRPSHDVWDMVKEQYDRLSGNNLIPLMWGNEVIQAGSRFHIPRIANLTSQSITFPRILPIEGTITTEAFYHNNIDITHEEPSNA